MAATLIASGTTTYGWQTLAASMAAFSGTSILIEIDYGSVTPATPDLGTAYVMLPANVWDSAHTQPMCTNSLPIVERGAAIPLVPGLGVNLSVPAGARVDMWFKYAGMSWRLYYN